MERRAPVCKLPPQPPLKMVSTVAGQQLGQQQQNKHLDHDEDRDPHYDYDHSVAHHAEDLRRSRTMSIGHLPASASSSAAANLTRLTDSRQVVEELKDFTLAESDSVHVFSSSSAAAAAAAVSSSSSSGPMIEEAEKNRRRRRGSHDEVRIKPRKFLIDVQATLRKVLDQEDTDGNCQITITDAGPKLLTLGTVDSRGHNKFELRGTYALANLLQELAIASDHGRRYVILDELRLIENPVERLCRLIKHHFWDGLTRRIDADGLEMICLDPKNRSADQRMRIYVPHDDPFAHEYFSKVAIERPLLKLEVVQLPEQITPQYVKSINDRPGILSLALRETVDSEGKQRIRGVPFVVPGGRFNEMYNWDSYFESLGLLADGRVHLAKSMADNFFYEIRHYGKLLNANRSYYLTRSQPPFLTDMVLQIFHRLPLAQTQRNLEWLSLGIRSAIREYWNVWMRAPRLVAEFGLSRFHGEGIGMPPETESTHFDAVIKPFADRAGLSISDYSQRYNDGLLSEPELDRYFIHDRAVRESGHDTTYRLEGRCASIIPFELNCLLYKYEMDIGTTIRSIFADQFINFDGRPELSSDWFARAERRKQRLNDLCWNESAGLYFDYDIEEHRQSNYESVTNFYGLWAGLVSTERAPVLVKNCLRLFEVQGGLVSGTERSRGDISLSRPNRQWDYPYGWAPHQIIAWKGLHDYGYAEDARRTAYRWLYMITKSFVDFNGVVPEKFDVVSLNHKVDAEYGNQGIDFKFIPREGFGWMNSSYIVGLAYMTTHMKRALGTLVHPTQLLQSKYKDSKQ